MDRLIAARVRENPALAGRALGVLRRWRASASADVWPVLDEWRAILDGPLEGVLAVLEGEDERAVRLRQSSPFCGILPREERTRILLEHAGHDASPA